MNNAQQIAAILADLVDSTYEDSEVSAEEVQAAYAKLRRFIKAIVEIAIEEYGSITNEDSANEKE